MNPNVRDIHNLECTLKEKNTLIDSLRRRISELEAKLSWLSEAHRQRAEEEARASLSQGNYL